MDHSQTCRSSQRLFNARRVIQWCDQRKIVARSGKARLERCPRSKPGVAFEKIAAPDLSTVRLESGLVRLRARGTSALSKRQLERLCFPTNTKLNSHCCR